MAASTELPRSKYSRHDAIFPSTRSTMIASCVTPRTPSLRRVTSQRRPSEINARLWGARELPRTPFGEQLVSSAEEGWGIRAFYVRREWLNKSAVVPLSPHWHSPYKQEVTGSIPVPPIRNHAGLRPSRTLRVSLWSVIWSANALEVALLGLISERVSQLA